jgi:hypothetical protein
VDAWARLFEDEQEAWRFLLGEEFEMQEPIVIPVDIILHTDERPFCDQEDCPCHEDRELVDKLTEQVTSGLLNVIEANRIFRGIQL